MPRTDAELRGLLPHVCYEVRMLLMTELLLLQDVEREPVTDDLDAWCIHNALLESITIHQRVLYEFFFQLNPRPDDAVAADYVPDWPKHRPVRTELLETVRPRVGKEIAHLTYRRIPSPGAASHWTFVAITDELVTVLTRWLALAPQFVHDALDDYLRHFHQHRAARLPRVRDTSTGTN